MARKRSKLLAFSVIFIIVVFLLSIVWMWFLYLSEPTNQQTQQLDFESQLWEDLSEEELLEQLEWQADFQEFDNIEEEWQEDLFQVDENEFEVDSNNDEINNDIEEDIELEVE